MKKFIKIDDYDEIVHAEQWDGKFTKKIIEFGQNFDYDCYDIYLDTHCDDCHGLLSKNHGYHIEDEITVCLNDYVVYFDNGSSHIYTDDQFHVTFHKFSIFDRIKEFFKSVL